MNLKELSESQVCSECGGPAFTDLILAEKKDACYYKVKASAKVWPSAYASGRLVQCRKKGASNYGKSRNESLAEFAPVGSGGGTPPRGPKTPGRDPWGGDDSGEDPYSRPDPRHYSRSIDFFGRFEADHFDEEVFDEKTGIFKGYWYDREAEDGKIQIAYFKFDDPRQAARDFDDSPGMGWYYEPMDEGLMEQQLDEKCWDTHRQAGMKKKGNRMVPNCVPKESKNVMENNQQIYNQVYQIMIKQAPEFMYRADNQDVKRAIIKAMSFGDQISPQDLASYAYGMLKSNSIDEDANPNFIWIQGDFDGDTIVSGPEQGSWRDQQTRQIELIRGRLSNVERLDGPPAQGGKTIKQARIPLTLDAGGKQFSTTGVDLQLTVAPNGYVTKGEHGRVVGTAVVKIMRPGAANEDVSEDYNPEYDDEAGMADNNLETLKRAVEGIDDLIQTGDNLPEWCQEKIANAKSMLVAVWDYMYSEEASDEVDPEVDAMFEAIDSMAAALARKYNVSLDEAWASFEALPDHVLYETAQFRLSVLNEDWQKVNKQDRTDGMSRKAVKAYRRENPGSKLKTAVTTKPSKLKKGGKAAKRRKSFCARMRGMKKSRASAKTKRNPNSPINKALRRWNC